MMPWLRVVVAAMCLTALGSVALAQSPEAWDRYLDKYRGPYRGRVIDANTKAPLAGAVFVALWRRDRVYPLHTTTENYAVKEAVTDADGRFDMDARSLEEGAPRRTHRPEFVIFLPGYGAFPRFHKAPRGFLGGVFEGLGTSIELPRLEGREERRKNLGAIHPYSISDTPFKDLSHLMHRINEERTAIGLSPYPSPESR
jgi:hypothetical protein